MKQHLTRWTTRLGLLALLASLTACGDLTATNDEPDAASETTDEIASYLTQTLSLSAEASASVRAAVGRHEGKHEPGYSWYVAASLQDSLTAEQKQQLLDRAAQAVAERPLLLLGRDGQGGKPGGSGLGGHHGRHVLDSLLTDEQEAAVEALHTRYRDQFQALHEQLRDGSLSEDDFRTQMLALHEALQAEVDALLTDEQRAALEALRAEREAERAEREAQERAVMAEVLGLTADQQSALDALRSEQEDARLALADQLRAVDITEDEAGAALAALRAQALATVDALLGDEAFEVFELHEALAVLRPGGKGPGGKGPGSKGPGGKGPGGKGPGGTGGGMGPGGGRRG